MIAVDVIGAVDVVDGIVDADVVVVADDAFVIVNTNLNSQIDTSKRNWNGI